MAEPGSEQGLADGLLSVLRDRGLKAAMCAPSGEGKLGSDGKQSAYSFSPGSLSPGIEFDESGEGVEIDAEISAMDNTSKYAALAKKYQLNLHDPEQVRETGLEDPGLVLHTAARRQRLAEIAKEQDELPDETFLDAEDIKARRSLSALVTSLEEAKSQIDCESCTLFGLANACDPALSKKLKSSCEKLDEIVAGLRLAQASLTLARRSSEAANDGAKRRAAHFKKAMLEAQS
jgi:hypothetical protein